MTLLNSELLLRLLNTPGGRAKFVMNDRVIMFFPASQQHREAKASGVSYEDEHKGNAVAGIASPGKVEIRFHSRYSDERIRTIWNAVRSTPELANVSLGKLFYQGRELL